MTPPSRPRPFPGPLLLAALLLGVLTSIGAEALAHGGPVKVIEDRFVVTMALWPAAETTRLRFFVRDFQSGRAPAAILSFRARILEDGSRGLICEAPPAPIEDGEANLLCRFPRDGFYEVFLQFWSDGEPARVYEPEDWRVWIGEADGAGRWVSTVVVGTAAVTIVMLGVSSWRRRGEGKDGA